MNGLEAEKIVNEYGGAIAASKVRRESKLPYPKSKIKQAYFAYIEEIFKQYGALSEQVGQNLVMTYAMLNSFLPDAEADELEEISKKIDKKELDFNKEEGVQKLRKFGEYVYSSTNGELFDEINEFIGECQKENK